MRLFVAVDLDEAVRRSAEQALNQAASRLRSAKGLTVRWTRAENLHLTLCFLGEVGEARYQRLERALQPGIACAPFEAELVHGGVFPPTGPPRVVWFGVGRGQDALCDVQAEVATRLATVGFERESRPFRAHLTVGRIKETTRASGEALRQTMAGTSVVNGRWRVDHVTLYESKPLRDGPVYAARLETGLQSTICDDE